MKIAQSREEVLGAVPPEHLAKDEHQHPDGEHEFEKEKAYFLWICAHVFFGLPYPLHAKGSN